MPFARATSECWCLSAACDPPPHIDHCETPNRHRLGVFVYPAPMAVQPDKRPYERQLIESGMNLTERYRVGSYTLQAPARITHPRTYVIACDHPGLEGGLSVDYDLHDGWTVSDGGERFVSRVSERVCLEWFVGRQ